MINSTRTRVELLPFQACALSSQIEFNVEVERRENIVLIEYQLQGNIESILFPPKSEKYSRLDNLWNHTCFEGFFSLGNELSYWELNLSPSEDWNIYHFDNYRQGRKLENQIEIVQKKFTLLRAEAKYEVALDFKKLLSKGQVSESLIDVGLTAILESKDQTKSYWAIQHLGSEPDFHIRHSFKVTV